MLGALCYRKSVCLSMSVTWGISRKRLKLGSCSFHRTVALCAPLCFYGISFIQKFWGVPPKWGVKQGWVGRTCYFRSSNAFARWLHKLQLLSLLRCPNLTLIARWRHCRALTLASARLSCLVNRLNRQKMSARMMMMMTIILMSAIFITAAVAADAAWHPDHCYLNHVDCYRVCRNQCTQYMEVWCTKPSPSRPGPGCYQCHCEVPKVWGRWRRTIPNVNGHERAEINEYWHMRIVSCENWKHACMHRTANLRSLFPHRIVSLFVVRYKPADAVH